MKSELLVTWTKGKENGLGMDVALSHALKRGRYWAWML